MSLSSVSFSIMCGGENWESAIDRDALPAAGSCAWRRLRRQIFLLPPTACRTCRRLRASGSRLAHPPHRPPRPTPRRLSCFIPCVSRARWARWDCAEVCGFGMGATNLERTDPPGQARYNPGKNVPLRPGNDRHYIQRREGRRSTVRYLPAPYCRRPLRFTVGYQPVKRACRAATRRVSSETRWTGTD